MIEYTPTEKSKVRVFLKDTVLSGAVWKVLQTTFLKPSKDRDVNSLAAKQIAIELLGESWKELEKLLPDGEKQKEEAINIGL